MKNKVLRVSVCLAALLNLAFVVPDDVSVPSAYLNFDGSSTYVEIPDSTDFSVDTTGGLTISAWMRPDVLRFPSTEGSGYVHWLGKGERGTQEWVFRMYSQDNTEGRENRISFYVFDGNTPPPLRGCGSYFQDPVQAKRWIHVVGIADNSAMTTAIYKNGELRNTNSYA